MEDWRPARGLGGSPILHRKWIKWSDITIPNNNELYSANKVCKEIY